ncbi:hypothetical protein CYMTET_17362, partial [Cymbomonas tetramitiformis]
KVGIWARLGDTLRGNTQERASVSSKKLAVRCRLGDESESSKAGGRRVVVLDNEDKTSARKVLPKSAVGTNPVKPSRVTLAKESTAAEAGSKRKIINLASTSSKLDMSLEDIAKKKPKNA